MIRRVIRNPNVTAGLKWPRDVADRGDHDGDHEPVRERDADQVGAGHDRAGPDERQRESADQLGGRASERVHGREATATVGR